MDRPSRKEKDIERARRDIMEAAAHTFAQQGFHGTKMEDIARAAGFGVASLYTYFKGKEELYRDLLDTVAEQFAAAFEEPLLPSLGFRDRFEWLLRRQFDLVEKHREFFVMFAGQRASCDWGLNSEVGDLSRQHYLRWIDRMEALAKAGIETGDLRPGDTRNIAYFMVGVLNASVFRWIAGDLKVSLPEHVPALMELIFQGVGSTAGEEL